MEGTKDIEQRGENKRKKWSENRNKERTQQGRKQETG
jgi:hypothetical protein